MNLIPIEFPADSRAHIAGIAQIAASVGTIVGSFSTSYLTDRFGTVWVGRVLIALFSFSLALFVLTANIMNVPMIYITAMLMGALQFSFEGYFLILISKHF